MKGQKQKMIAWSVELTAELYQRLPEDAIQEKANWTLKAVGNADDIQKWELELQQIANSIELIQEIWMR